MLRCFKGTLTSEGLKILCVQPAAFCFKCHRNYLGHKRLYIPNSRIKLKKLVVYRIVQDPTEILVEFATDLLDRKLQYLAKKKKKKKAKISSCYSILQ